ncbi:MAG: hypothetical protein [Caudoviricetes sp.]|nr:MAG: hypothetical protein [Caudoviricetes sp.]
MATLKDHQQAMVDLLASGSGIPASASRLAHAMHDVLSAILAEPDLMAKAIQESKAIRQAYTTPGLNDKALAGDIEACRLKATPAERRVKELENTVKQLRANNAKLKDQYESCFKALEEATTDCQNMQYQLDCLRGEPEQPEQAGCRKDDTQVCAHDSWEDVAHGDKRCCDCGELFR